MITCGKKVVNCVSYASIFTAIAMVVVFTFWKVYPYKTIVINQRPLPVLTKEVRRGGALFYKLDYCKYTDLPVLVSRKFTDTVVYSLPDITTNNPTGCRVQNIGVEIPKNLPEGDYVLSVSYTYKVNPVRDVVTKTHTEKFSVIGD